MDNSQREREALKGKATVHCGRARGRRAWGRGRTKGGRAPPSFRGVGLGGPAGRQACVLEDFLAARGAEGFQDGPGARGPHSPHCSQETRVALP